MQHNYGSMQARNRFYFCYDSIEDENIVYMRVNNGINQSHIVLSNLCTVFKVAEINASKIITIKIDNFHLNI